MVREYKDSGIEWIGRIPKDWKTEKFKHIFRIKKIIAGKLGYDVLSVTQQGLKVKNINEGQVANDYSNYQIVHVGDFVMNHMDLLTGYVDVSKQEGVTSPDYRSFYAIHKHEIDCRYYLYIFQFCYMTRLFYNLGQGVSNLGRWRLPAEQQNEFVLPFPPLIEQQRIASYLDKKCAEIDSLVELQEQMIAQLTDYKQSVITEAVTKGLNPEAELVSSGIDWIGDVPKGWRCVRFYFSNWIRGRLGWKGLKSEEYTESGYPFLSAFNIINNKLDWSDINYINQERYDESPEIKLNTGDVLLVKDGAGIGKCARVDALPLGESTVNSSLAVITPKEFVNYKYLYYYLQSNSFWSVINLLLVGMGVPHLTQTNMKNIWMPLPPLTEQRAIASYLDAKCHEIDTLISIKRQKIETLKEYKKSIIFEAVTGKAY